MQVLMFLSIGLLALAISSTAAKVDHGSYDEPCSLYMAPSTIPGAGWGVFTAVDIAEGETIGDPISFIPVLDNFKTLPYRGQQHFLSWLGYVYPAEPDYFYRATQDSFPTIPKAMYKVDPGLNKATALQFRNKDGEEISAFAPGIASLVNSDYDFVNIEVQVDGRDAAFVASNNIEAGSELLFYYGDEWYDDLELREQSEVEYDTLEDYNENILPTITLDDEEAKRASYHSQPRKSLYMDDDDEGLYTNDCRDVDGEVKQCVGNTINTVVEDDGVLNEAEEEEDDLQTEEEYYWKPIDWIKANGICIDNLRSGPAKKQDTSTITTRNHSAFAKKHIPKGERIAPAPLLVIKRDDLVIYEADTSQLVFGDVLNFNKVVGKEPLLTYCYGHNDSELLLLPYSPVVNFINHGGKMANTEIRWPKDSSNEWLNLHPLDVLDMSGKIMAEFVALRDIQPDEEILIDYGKDWENAWKEYEKGNGIMTEFRHEIGVPDDFYPDAWKNQSVVYELAMKPLQPGELELMRWKHNGKAVCKHCYRVGMPPGLVQHIQDFAEERGIIKLYEKLLNDDILDNNEWTTFETHGEQWFAQQYEARAWNFNMHYVAAWDEAARKSFLGALLNGGLGTVLESLGKAYGLDNMTCFHTSFMGVSQADNSFTHTDVYASGEKGFNLLWPVLSVNGSSPELDIVSDDTNIVLPVNYDYDVVYALGDWGYHKTSPNRYEERGQIRITMNAYCAQIDDTNARMMHFIYDGEKPAPFCGQFYGEREIHWVDGESPESGL